MHMAMSYIDTYVNMRKPMLFVDICDTIPSSFKLSDFAEHFDDKGIDVVLLGWDHISETVFDFEDRIVSIKEELSHKNCPVAVMFMGLHAYTEEMQKAVIDLHETTPHMVFGYIGNHDSLADLSQEFINIFEIFD